MDDESRSSVVYIICAGFNDSAVVVNEDGCKNANAAVQCWFDFVSLMLSKGLAAKGSR